MCENCIHTGLCSKEFDTTQKLRYNKSYKCSDYKDFTQFVEMPCSVDLDKMDKKHLIQIRDVLSKIIEER